MFIHRNTIRKSFNTLVLSNHRGWQPHLTKHSAPAKIKLTPSNLVASREKSSIKLVKMLVL